MDDDSVIGISAIRHIISSIVADINLSKIDFDKSMKMDINLNGEKVEIYLIYNWISVKQKHH